ncbi:hypothetical protein F2Q68_00038744 [Brassica cretica]|uniref:non-specific serine/threonine protein kinase n=1 Tax=Brassica cretica TaxID=69181 RepID=A0A8S9MJ53_BRACR|nr:hypothetical protein F2Q68_00038744 [Brassica cretica]
MVTEGMRVGKYELGRTLGEGNSAKVKLATDIVSGQSFAVKIIDKSRTSRLNVPFQIKREIRTLKVLKHPNIVRLHEVLASKTKIYMVLECVAGGDLFDRIVRFMYTVSKGKLSETEGRKMFQQLIDGISYCHNKGIFHRDLKEDGLLHTTCGSPNYVAPEVLANKGYDGAASDIWSCGVILYAILTGCLPFDDTNLAVLCRKIVKGDPPIPRWLSPGAKTMIKRMLDPNPVTRMTVASIMGNDWFRHDYSPSSCDAEDESSSVEEDVSEEEKSHDSSTVINAFQLIGMSPFLDLSGLFETEVLASKTKIYMVLECVTGGDLFDRIEDGLLHTTCGSPNYVTPEVLANKGYDGAASDIWSCGVILYVILTGCLPFDDTNLAVLCRKIFKGDPPIPRWLSPGAKTMIKRMLDPNPVTRMTVTSIM